VTVRLELFGLDGPVAFGWKRGRPTGSRIPVPGWRRLAPGTWGHEAWPERESPDAGLRPCCDGAVSQPFWLRASLTAAFSCQHPAQCAMSSRVVRVPGWSGPSTRSRSGSSSRDKRSAPAASPQRPVQPDDGRQRHITSLVPGGCVEARRLPNSRPSCRAAPNGEYRAVGILPFRQFYGLGVPASCWTDSQPLMTLTVYLDDVAGRTARNPRPHGRSLIPFRGQSSHCWFVSVRLACPGARG
jgi:hypothetical protein